MIIQVIFKGETMKEIMERCKRYFRWNSPRFIKLFAKMAYQQATQSRYKEITGGFFLIVYLLHWVVYDGSLLHQCLSLILHFSLLMAVISFFLFDRAEIGSVEKLHISRDKDTNVIG